MVGKPLGWEPLNNQPKKHHSEYLLGSNSFTKGVFLGLFRWDWMTGCLGSRVTNLTSVENPDWLFLHRDFDYPLIWHSSL